MNSYMRLPWISVKPTILLTRWLDWSPLFRGLLFQEWAARAASFLPASSLGGSLELLCHCCWREILYAYKRVPLTMCRETATISFALNVCMLSPRNSSNQLFDVPHGLRKHSTLTLDNLTCAEGLLVQAHTVVPKQRLTSILSPSVSSEVSRM